MSYYESPRYSSSSSMFDVSRRSLQSPSQYSRQSGIRRTSSYPELSSTRSSSFPLAYQVSQKHKMLEEKLLLKVNKVLHDLETGNLTSQQITDLLDAERYADKLIDNLTVARSHIILTKQILELPYIEENFQGAINLLRDVKNNL